MAHPLTAEALLYILNALTEDNGCLIWRGGKDQDGYGWSQLRRQRQGAHRLVWELLRGPIPDGLLVLHHCDNPPCVSPNHLWLGTNADNMADRDAKGRQATGARNGMHTKPWTRTAKRGSLHPGAILTESAVAAIRERAAVGISSKTLAEAFGVHQSTINGIVAGRSWKNVQVIR